MLRRLLLRGHAAFSLRLLSLRLLSQRLSPRLLSRNLAEKVEAFGSQVEFRCNLDIFIG